MKNLLKLLVLATIFSFTEVASAQVGFGIYFGTPPPPPPVRRDVIVVRPYPEAVWVPGYWSYDYGVRNYVWVGGRWDRPPHPGAIWRGGTWRHQPKGYYYAPGHWSRGRGRGHR
jgi:hypothetical protein